MATVKDIGKAVFNELGESVKGLTVAKTVSIIEKAFEDIVGCVENDEKVKINGFGTFSKKEKAARDGRNPSNGETVKIPAKNVLHFKEQKEVLEQPKPSKKKK